jgi:hypothetical protein
MPRDLPVQVTMTEDEWQVVVSALWDFARAGRRTASRKESVLAVRRSILSACGWTRPDPDDPEDVLV